MKTVIVDLSRGLNFECYFKLVCGFFLVDFEL